jgi:hypothetical protein
MAVYNKTTINALRHLHPPRAKALDVTKSFNDSLDTSSESFPVTEKDIKEAILSFPAGSAGGMDGMRPQHLKDMIKQESGQSGQRLISLLTKFVILCLSGKVPDAIYKTDILWRITLRIK